MAQILLQTFFFNKEEGIILDFITESRQIHVRFILNHTLKCVHSSTISVMKITEYLDNCTLVRGTFLS